LFIIFDFCSKFFFQVRSLIAEIKNFFIVSKNFLHSIFFNVYHDISNYIFSYLSIFGIQETLFNLPRTLISPPTTVTDEKLFHTWSIIKKYFFFLHYFQKLPIIYMFSPHWTSILGRVNTSSVRLDILSKTVTNLYYD